MKKKHLKAATNHNAMPDLKKQAQKSYIYDLPTTKKKIVDLENKITENTIGLIKNTGFKLQ